MMMRLDKMLAHMGYGSRKDVKKIIKSKMVMINDIIITKDDYKVNTKEDRIIVFNELVNYLDEVYIMLNKPDGVVSATYDDINKTVIDLVDKYRNYKIFPVGRLDIDTTGLLLITNNGKIAYNMLSPKKHVDKTYLVSFEGTFKNEYYKSFENGIILDDGYKTLPSKIQMIDDNRCYLTIKEGKYHQVKRMFEALNMNVVALKRITFGPLTLDENLKEGEYRLLDNKEIEKIKEYE